MSSAASGATVHRQQIVVDGNQNFAATGINDDGTIVGELYAPITGAPTGIILRKGVATTIAPPYAGGAPAYPTQIESDGTIVGYSRSSTQLPLSFVSKDGRTNPTYEYLLDEPSNVAYGAGVNPVGLAGTQIYFTRFYDIHIPNQGFYGTPPDLTAVPHLGFNTFVRGLSPIGIVSGEEHPLEGFGYLPGSVFVGRGGTYTLLAPPGSLASYGGVQDDLGVVAGSYIDTGRAWHGFVYAYGVYASFDMPEAASSITASAINDTGLVVGYYQSAATGRQHGFIYNGHTVAAFGAFDPQVQLTLALNNHGTILLSENFNLGLPKFLSYEVSCGGSGC